MRAKQAFLGVVTPLGFGLLCVLFLGNGCSKSNSTSSGSSGGGTQSAASPVSLPEFYGIYAVDGGKPVAIHQAADQEFSPNVQLIINAKSIGTGKTPSRLFLVPWGGPGMNHPEGEFSWDQLGAGDITSNIPTTQSSAGYMTGPVTTHVKPVDAHPEMIQVVPEQPLQPGLYQFEGDVQFWVGRDQLQTLLTGKVQAALDGRQWRDAARAATDKDVISGKFNSPDSLRYVVFAKASQAAKDAAAQNRWDDVSEPAQVALSIRGDADLQKLFTDISYLKPAKAAQDALAAKQWVTAVADANQALQVRYNDAAMQEVIAMARSGAAMDDAKNALAAGNFDQAILAARAALWMQPDNKEMADLIGQASYQQGMAKANSGLASNDLDTAFDGAEEAVAHKPDSQEAEELLKKIRAAISTSHGYFGRHLVPVWDLKVSNGPIMNLYPSNVDKTFVVAAGTDALLCDPVQKTTLKLPINVSDGLTPASGPFIFLSRNGGGCNRIDVQGNVLWSTDKLPQNVSPDGKLIACLDPEVINTGQSHALYLLDATTGRTAFTVDVKMTNGHFFKSGGKPDICGGFSKDGKLGAYRGADGAWNVVDLSAGKVVHTFPSQGPVSFASFGGDNFAYSNASQVAVENTTNWQDVTSVNISGGMAPVDSALEVTSDGKTLVVQGANEGLRLFNAVTGDPIGKPLGSGGHVLSRDGSAILMINGRDFNAFRTSDGVAIGTISQASASGYASPVFSPDGIYLPHDDGSVELRSPQTWPDVSGIRSLTPHQIIDQANLFDPDTLGRTDAAIAKIKQQFGIDVIVQANPGVPNNIPVQPDLTNANTILPSYLKDLQATQGTPGFYIVITRYPANVTWGEVPPAGGELLNPDQPKSLGGRLDGMIAGGDPAQSLTQFVRELGRDLQQDHPEMAQ